MPGSRVREKGAESSKILILCGMPQFWHIFRACRLTVLQPSPSFRTHHLHLVPFSSQLWLERRSSGIGFDATLIWRPSTRSSKALWPQNSSSTVRRIQTQKRHSFSVCWLNRGSPQKDRREISGTCQEQEHDTAFEATGVNMAEPDETLRTGLEKLQRKTLHKKRSLCCSRTRTL